MKPVSTVKGMVDSSNLGVTLIHEHICFRFVGKSQTGGKHLDEAYSYNLEMLREAKKSGINTIVDLTPWPNVELIRKLNSEVPEINIILSTGAYVDENLEEKFRGITETEMESRMFRHVTEGFEGTGIRAGLIKVATRWDIKPTQWEIQNIRAAARVQRRCGIPIAVHAVSHARIIMDILKGEGADIGSVFFAHTEAKFGWEGRTIDEQCRYLYEILAEGAFLQFCNFGFEFDTPIRDLLYIMKFIESEGFGERILLSVDTNIEVDDDGRIWHEAEKRYPETKERTYSYAVRKIIPLLMTEGTTLQDINKYFIDNPRRFFESALWK